MFYIVDSLWLARDNKELQEAMTATRDILWGRFSGTTVVKVYHSGKDEKRIAAPFALVLSSERLPLHPDVRDRERWKYWKQTPLNAFAVNVQLAVRSIADAGYYIQ